MGQIKILFGLEATEGGAAKHLTYLATNLRKELFDITVIVSHHRSVLFKSDVLRMQARGVRVINIPMQRNINPLNDLYALVKIYYHIKNEKYDIVHAHSSKAGILFRVAAFLNRRPAIAYTPHCFYFQAYVGYFKFFYLYIEKLVAKFTDSIITVSSSEKDIAIREGIASVETIECIVNAIDLNEYHQLQESTAIRQNYNITSTGPIIASIGRLTRQKDLLTYIHAAQVVLKTYPDAVFLIVGKGELHNKLRKTIDDLNLEQQVILTGEVKDIHQIYNIIDLLVNTSLWEGLPYVILEAMLFKRPVVATKVSGNQDIVIDGKTGYLAPQKNYELVAKAIEKILSNKSLANEMGKEGHKTLKKKFIFDNFISAHESLYKGLVESRLE
ncbi:MAG: hypothetical protein COB85_08840 [Bacteroidetes bacterium]|nr:MAG: hypothetical protein COB85_08840 [Bacteroidota bacterium]